MKQPNPFERRFPNEAKIGLVSISDRASQGVYVDEGIPSLRNWLSRVITTPVVFHESLIPDEIEHITSS
jgi:molybdopterin adenylyltransferase